MVIIIVAVVACLAAFAAFQEAVACQEETCQASSADILVVVHHIAQEEVACLEASAWADQNQEGGAFQAGSSRTFVEGTAGVGTAHPAAVLG